VDEVGQVPDRNPDHSEEETHDPDEDEPGDRVREEMALPRVAPREDPEGIAQLRDRPVRRREDNEARHREVGIGELRIER
jgi:hypothetical protein